MTDSAYIASLLPPRIADGNKGTFGRVLLLCGSRNMRGAAALCALGALRMGAGLVTIATTAEVIDALAGNLYEALWCDREREDILAKAAGMRAVAIGCGMGQTEETLSLVRSLLQQEGAPLVLDADAINVLAGKADLLSAAKRKILLTPHPLEFSRLSGLSVEAIQANRQTVAADFAKQYGVTLLLKGHGTVITDGERVFVNPTGGSALSKGGTGDVLCGMATAFLAQGCDPFDAAVLAAYLHGAAGDALAETYSDYGVLASELPAEAAKQMQKLRKNHA